MLGLVGDEALDLLFLQEVPLGGGWAAAAEAAGFGVATDATPTYRVRSALLWRHHTVTAEPFTLPTAGYHGSYLVAVRLSLPNVGETTAVSVHASPSPVEARYLEKWLETGLPPPKPRPAARAGELWDSDLVLATLAGLSEESPVLAAGDFNECLAWDTTHRGQWGKEYFARVTEAGLVSLTHRSGASETQTAFTHDGLEYQLDHVLASPAVAAEVRRSPRVDPGWSRDRVVAGEISDHAPLWFEVGES